MFLKLVQIKAILPDGELAVLECLLVAIGGDVGREIDSILAVIRGSSAKSERGLALLRVLRKERETDCGLTGRLGHSSTS